MKNFSSLLYTPVVVGIVWRSLAILALAFGAAWPDARGQSNSCVPPPAGLVAWWTGDGDARDFVGGNHGTMQNGAGFAPAMAGEGFQLDGQNDFVLIPDSSTLDLSNEITVEFWFKSTGWEGGDAIVDKRTSSDCNYGVIVSSDWGFQLYYNDPSIFGGDHPGNQFEISAFFPLPAEDVFHHFAGTYRHVDSTHIELNSYLNGLLVRSRTFLGSLANTMNDSPFVIGAARGGAGEFFKGTIDEVSLYNRALSPEEVQAIYGAGAAGKCKTAVAPQISRQPQSLARFESEAAVFEVAASGSPPLSYQWYLNDAQLAGASEAQLVLAQVRAADAGNYWVVVSNEAGSVTSSVVALTVDTNAPVCVQVPAGLVSWWTGDGTSEDLVGENHGGLRNGATFAPGRVGLGFLLDGVDDYVLIPDSPSLRLSNEVTFELWFKAQSSAWGGIFDKRSWTDCNYGLVVTTDHGVQLYYNDPTVFGGDHPGNQFEIAAHFPLPSLEEFHHFAGTFRQVDATQIQLKMYIDGTVVESRIFSGNLARTMNQAPIAIGAARGGAGEYFKGVIDEVSLYSRALSAEEIQGIYRAGFAGKCKEMPVIAPLITTQPRSQVVLAGQNAALAVEATGSRPLTYRWYHDGQAVAGATGERLVLVNVQEGDGGPYTVVVSNVAGLVTSDLATLTVDTKPPVCIIPPSGLVAWWTGDGTAEDQNGSNHGQLHGGAGYAEGKVGLGFALDGVDDFVLIPDSATLRLTNELTFDLWFKAESESWGGLIDKRDDPWGCNYGLFVSQEYGVQLYYNDPHVYGGDYANNIHEISAYFPLPALDMFHHIAGTYRQVDPGHICLKTFLDGQLVSTRTFEGNLANTLNGAPLAIGAASGVCCNFKGVIDEVSLYDRALSGEEIQGIYQAGAAGKCREALGPRILTQPLSATVLPGSSAAFSVNAVGGPSLSYQWSFNGEPIPGATNTQFMLDAVQVSDAGSYSVTVSNPVDSITSEAAILTVDTNVIEILPPAIVSHPTNQTVIEGGAVVLGVIADGTSPLSYQWLQNGLEIAGANASTFSLNQVALSDAGVYAVRVFNSAGSNLSQEAMLTVLPDTRPPTIVFQPTSHNVAPGSSTTFTVSASGATPLSYHWRHNQIDLTGANAETMAVSNAGESDAGSYSVVVSNVFGWVVSEEATLTVTNVWVLGTVIFANRGGNVDAAVFDVDGITKLYGPGYRAELLAGSNPNTMAVAGAPANFIVPGYFTGGIRLIPGVLAGQAAYLQVRVWDSDSGTNYDQVLANGGKVGFSSVISVVTGGGGMPPGLPALLAGLESFSLRQGIAAAPVTAYISLDQHDIPGLRSAELGLFRWTLNGQSGARYAVECSTNLVDWAGLAIVTPVNGVATFQEPRNQQRRFYRARLLD